VNFQQRSDEIEKLLAGHEGIHAGAAYPMGVLKQDFLARLQKIISLKYIMKMVGVNEGNAVRNATNLSCNQIFSVFLLRSGRKEDDIVDGLYQFQLNCAFCDGTGKNRVLRAR
jgi:hypothetical protein